MRIYIYTCIRRRILSYNVLSMISIGGACASQQHIYKDALNEHSYIYIFIYNSYIFRKIYTNMDNWTARNDVNRKSECVPVESQTTT